MLLGNNWTLQRCHALECAMYPNDEIDRHENSQPDNSLLQLTLLAFGFHISHLLAGEPLEARYYEAKIHATFVRPSGGAISRECSADATVAGRNACAISGDETC